MLETINAPAVLVAFASALAGDPRPGLEGFYVDLVEEFGSDGVFIVPELSDISPTELKPYRL